MDKRVPEVRFKGFTDDWEQQKLGDKAIIKGRLGWKSLKQEEYTNEGPCMIAGKHIKNGIIDWSTVDHIPTWRYEESPEIMLKNEDIIFSKDGSLGNPALISGLNKKATINSTMMLVRTDNTIDSAFLYQILNGDIFKRLIYLKVSGSSIPHLFQADMNDFSFNCPQKKEQSNISLFLNKIDKNITLHQERLNLYESLKKYMLQNLFPNNGKKVPNVRFADFSGDWEQHKLGDVFQTIKNAFVGTATPYYVDQDQGGYFYLESNNVKNGKINKKSEVFINKEFYYNQKYNWLKTNDLVMVQSGHVGHTAVIPRELNNTAAHALIMFKNKRIDLNSNFLNYAFQTDKSKKKLNIISIGNTIKHILSSDMKTFKIYQPITVKEQDEIAKLILNIDRIITLHKKQLTMYENLKKYYMQKLFI